METKIIPRAVSPERRRYEFTLDGVTAALVEAARTKGEEVPTGQMHIWYHHTRDDPHILTLVVDVIERESNA